MAELTILEETKKKLPDDYLIYIQKNGGSILDNGINYLILWEDSELIQFNEEYEVLEYAPNFFFIASNGGGAGLAYKKTDQKLYSMPFIGMDEDDAVHIADSFTEFIARFDREEIEIY